MRELYIKWLFLNTNHELPELRALTTSELNTVYTYYKEGN